MPSHMDKAPEILHRPIPNGPAKLPAHQGGRKQGRIDVKELLKVGKGATVTKGSKPDALKLVESPNTEKWSSPVTKKPEQMKKLSQLSGKSKEKLMSVLDSVVVSNPNDYPWCTIGRVFVGWNDNFDSWMWSGTGTLVGPNLLLTASHVAPWGKSGWWMRFVPAYNNGAEPFQSSYVSDFYGVDNSAEQVDGLDYVICRLYTELGNTCGWMGSESFGDDGSYEGRQWTSVGYPGATLNAQVPIVQFDVSVDDVDDDSDGKKLETNNLFASPGWSGGPLWGFLTESTDPRVVGVMSGWEEESFLWWTIESDDVSAGGSHMVNLIIWAQQNWPPS